MSVRKLTTKLSMLLVLITGGVLANAQEPVLPPADPFAFDPDFQWFEPIYEADILDMKPKKRAHTGWFATYDKLKMYGKRPDSIDTQARLQDDYQLDKGGGNRYEVGYMRPDTDTGMLFTYMDLDVAATDGVRIDRINRINEDDLLGDTLFPLGPNRFGLPVFDEDGNVIGFSRRFYDLGESLNNVSMHSAELSKTWRMEPYHYGGILEPMLGVRYISADDQAFRRTYQRTVEDPLEIPLGVTEFYQTVYNGPDTLPQETLREEVSNIENDIYTMQAGFRYFKFQNRFRYSTEFRVFTGLNLQQQEFYRQENTTLYDSFDIGADVNYNITSKTLSEYERNKEFFIGYDIRAELGYQLTNMIHVRGGMQLVDLARGMWRNDRSFGLNNQAELIDDGDNRRQNYLAIGYTFGIELNR